MFQDFNLKSFSFVPFRLPKQSWIRSRFGTKVDLGPIKHTYNAHNRTNLTFHSGSSAFVASTTIATAIATTNLNIVIQRYNTRNVLCTRDPGVNDGVFEKARERDNVRNSIGNGSISGHRGDQTALHNIETYRIDTSAGS